MTHFQILPSYLADTQQLFMRRIHVGNVVRDDGHFVLCLFGRQDEVRRNTMREMRRYLRRHGEEVFISERNWLRQHPHRIYYTNIKGHFFPVRHTLAQTEVEEF